MEEGQWTAGKEVEEQRPPLTSRKSRRGSKTDIALLLGPSLGLPNENRDNGPKQVATAFSCTWAQVQQGEDRARGFTLLVLLQKCLGRS